MQITTAEAMIEAARQVSEKYHCAVLCKGGHQLNDANDLLYVNGAYRWFEGKRINNPNTHGTDVLSLLPLLPTLQKDSPWRNP